MDNKDLASCSKCGTITPINGFYKNKTKVLGRGSECKVCTKKLRAAYVQRNKRLVLEKQTEYQKRKYEESPEKFKKYWRERSRDVRKSEKWIKTRKACRNIVNKMTKRGVLKKGSCEYPNGSCKGQTEGHHWDYGKPLGITWFCRKHHELANKVYSLIDKQWQI